MLDYIYVLCYTNFNNNNCEPDIFCFAYYETAKEEFDKIRNGDLEYYEEHDMEYRIIEDDDRNFVVESDDGAAVMRILKKDLK